MQFGKTEPISWPAKYFLRPNRPLQWDRISWVALLPGVTLRQTVFWRLRVADSWKPTVPSSIQTGASYRRRLNHHASSLPATIQERRTVLWSRAFPRRSTPLLWCRRASAAYLAQRFQRPLNCRPLVLQARDDAFDVVQVVSFGMVQSKIITEVPSMIVKKWW